MKKKMSFLNLLAVLIVLFTGVYQANAADLRARSLVINPATGYPNWYQDANNLALSLCMDRNEFCLVDPTAQPFPADRAAISPQNFPPEVFYYMADTSGVSPGGTIDLNLWEAALEAGFATVQVDGGQAVFTRVRIRANVTVPGTYIVTHPYGVDTFVVAAGDIGDAPEINFTEDVPGLVANQFNAPLTSRVGPFLTRAILPTFVTDPATGNKYIGIPLQQVAVTGGVGGVNSVTITGPGADTLTLNTFSLMGKVIGMTLAPTVGGTDFGFAKLTPGVTKNFTVQNLTANAFTPVIAANVPNITPVTPSPDFTIVPGSACTAAPLAPNATCNFNVTFVPQANGVKTATILVSGTDVPPAQTTVTGTGDGIAPKVNLNASTLFTKLTTQTITGTVVDNVGGAGVASVNVTVNANAAVSVTPTGGAWSFTATGLNPNAVNDVSVTATDLALPGLGNTTTAATTGTITVDTIAPTGVAINTVNPQTNITTQTITGTASDLNSISVSVSVNGTAQQGTTAVTVGGTWSFNVTGLTNGANVIIATATDLAGNSTPSATATITVDTIPPALTLAAVTTPTKAASQTIGGTVEAGATVTVNGATVIVTPGTPESTWSFDFALAAPDGAKSIIIIATDAATNTTTVNSSITLDTAPPTATIGGTPANPSNNKGAVLTVAGDQVVSYQFKLDNGTFGPVTPATTQITLAGLADGSHTVSVIGIDAAGNLQLEANATAFSWTVDTVLPALTLNPVTALSRVNSQLITGTMEAGATVAVNGQPATVTGTTWSFTFPLTAPDGIKDITVTATDAATNVNTVTSSIILDTTAPALTLAAVATPTRFSTQTISGTVEAGATVTVNGQPATVTGATWSFGVTGLVEGVNSILVTATDPVGNPANQSSSINIVLPNGDINGDGPVSIQDALKSLQFAAGLIQPTAAEALHADVAPLVNGFSAPNGKVDTGDVMLILRKSVGNVTWQINN